MTQQSRVPQDLRAGVSALTILLGTGVGGYIVHDKRSEALMQHEYVSAVARDATTSRAVKIAMVMGSFYESSYRHIGTPYIDKLGKGQPLTVCNGITGAGVLASYTYSPAECYDLERIRYLGYEQWLVHEVPRWSALPLFTRASMLDFVHNKGGGAFRSSTMRRRLLAGDLEGACLENLRWNRGTVKGVSTILPGLDVRGKSNAEVCLWDAPPAPARPPVVASAPAMPEVLSEPPPPLPAPAAPPPRAWWQRLFGKNA